jgi:hypothetical protein
MLFIQQNHTEVAMPSPNKYFAVGRAAWKQAMTHVICA